MNQLCDAALYYLSLGWKIFPLCPGQKTPLTKHGCKDATGSRAVVQSWWSQWPDANIGLACGAASSVYVIDIDVKEGINGFESLKEFDRLPCTVRQDTPTGGSHCLFEASVPPANRNSFRPGIDIRGEGYYIVLAPSIHPNGEPYTWTPGYAPWEAKLATYPEAMRPAISAPRLSCIPAVYHAPPIESDIRQRASLYLSQCDPAIQGLGGHDKLLWAAVALVHGFLLSESQALDLLLREYNHRCSPPWDMSIQKDQRDFYRKVSEAMKLVPQKPSGWLLNDESYAPQINSTTTVDVSSLLCKSAGSAVSDSAVALPVRENLTCDFNPEQEYKFLIQPTGLLGSICSWINSTAFRDQPFLALACSLAFLGTLFGRKVKDELGSRTNLYCMGVAPSSAGKAHALSQIRLLARQSGCSRLLGGDDIASDSAIEARLEREPATLYLWDEMGHKLVQIKSGKNSHLEAVVSLLMKVYSAAGSVYLGKEYADQENQRLIVQPCCSIYGTSTLLKFADGISPSELQDGWMSRCLVFCSPFDVPKKRGHKDDSVPRDTCDLIEQWYLRELLPEGPLVAKTFVGNDGQKQAPLQLVVPTTPGAENIFVHFDNVTIEYGKQHPMLACLWAKGEENARRIALIVACGNSYDNPVITEADADYACRLVRYLLIDFSNTIAPEIVSGEMEARKRKIVRVVAAEGPDGCAKLMLTKRTPALTSRTRQEAVSDLLESGELVYRVPKNSASKDFRYWTAETYLEYIKQCPTNQ